jgi:mutual gliding-motility protein MglA
MATFNRTAKEVAAKIVYYGPGLCGKTTNVEHISQKVDPSTRGKLITLETEGERTLLFDMMPVQGGRVKNFDVRFYLHTVPGQVYYNASRKQVLRNADGIVFVADSSPNRLDANIESLINLYDNLQQHGVDPDSIPLVIQYNKRDVPGALPLEVLNRELNYDAVPAWEAVAVEGIGVFETLGEILRLVVADLKRKF